MEEDHVTASCHALVIGGSAGSLDVLFKLLPQIKPGRPFPIIIVLHRRNAGDSSLSQLFATKTLIPTLEVEDKDKIRASHIYLAPADYHLLIEKDRTFSLDYSEKINYSRPSLDVTFESASEVFGKYLVAILLSGANEDGTQGFKTIKNAGGRIVAQDPGSAQMAFMPQHAISHTQVDCILHSNELARYINHLTNADYHSPN